MRHYIHTIRQLCGTVRAERTLDLALWNFYYYYIMKARIQVV
jgi:hypothetical protein